MIFTREDILKIQNALLQLGRKDSEFKDANTPLNSDDYIAILQDGINKKVSINNLLSTLGLLKKDDFINVSDRYDEYYILLSEAITIIANNKRKKGLVITFLDIDGNWRIYLFIGELSNFIITDYWKDLHDFKYPIINTVLPDEEDLTLTYPNIEGNSFIKLKDKEYNLDNFSGLGKVILRKNIVEVEDPTYGKIKKNILYQDMINKENTIYVIQYDFTLGEDITIPENCILDFQGGSLNNGLLKLNNTLFTGNYIGKVNVELSGSNNTENYILTNYDGLINCSHLTTANNGVIIQGEVFIDKADVSCRTSIKGNGYNISKLHFRNNGSLLYVTKPNIEITHISILKDIPEDVGNNSYYSNALLFRGLKGYTICNNISIHNCYINTGIHIFTSDDTLYIDNVSINDNIFNCDFTNIDDDEGEGQLTDKDVISLFGCKNVNIYNNSATCTNIKRFCKISAGAVPPVGVGGLNKAENINIYNNNIVASSVKGGQLFDLFYGTSSIKFTGNRIEILNGFHDIFENKSRTNTNYGSFIFDNNYVKLCKSGIVGFLRLTSKQKVSFNNNNIEIEDKGNPVYHGYIIFDCPYATITNNKITRYNRINGIPDILCAYGEVKEDYPIEKDENGNDFDLTKCYYTIHGNMLINASLQVFNGTADIRNNQAQMSKKESIVRFFDMSEIYVCNNILNTGDSTNYIVLQGIYSNLKNIIIKQNQHYEGTHPSYIRTNSNLAPYITNIKNITIIQTDNATRYGNWIEIQHFSEGYINSLRNMKEGLCVFNYTNKSYMQSDGSKWNQFALIKKGESRITSPTKGEMFFDTTLNKPIWWNGTAWIDATGVTV